MSKKGFIEVVVSTLAVISTFFFFINLSPESIFSLLLILPLSITIFLLYKCDLSKSNKVIKVILIILGIYDILFLSFIIFQAFMPTWMMDQYGNKFLYFDLFQYINMFLSIIFMAFLFTTFIFSLDDLDKGNNNYNFVMIIVSSLVIFLIHTRFFLTPVLKDNVSDIWYEGSSIYIEQNYVYFTFMYLAIIISKFINKKLEKD